MTTKNPNVILRRIRSSVQTLSRSPVAVPPDMYELIQAVTDMDNHLSWGGTPPDDWKGAPFAIFTARAQEPAPRREPAAVRRIPAHDVDPVEDLIRRM